MLKKPSQKTIVDAAVLVGSAVGGAALSRGAFGAIPLTPPASGTDYKKIGARLALIAVGIAGAASISGNDAVATGAKGALAGVAIQQGLDLIADFAAASPSATALTSSTNKISQFKARTLGLNCACDQKTYALGKPRRRALRAVDTSEYGNHGYQPTLLGTDTTVNGLDAIFAKVA
ncbi:hypothetical protein ACI6PS_03555 [Flavobacterium sp. PLA-1-15]|uniref:hypothetical protein n=1 Tax=Flavobacterium sp. PLA-1-15 TaxID=3380533 RepID=UPI003B7ABC66